ncbi:hypothetical protein OF83DRAFT_1262261 [Amylostereum chailletii]|nr:hypothetical protein OF83DRAFT_1262261 [Amylostereum chailletii]
MGDHPCGLNKLGVLTPCQVQEAVPSAAISGTTQPQHHIQARGDDTTLFDGIHIVGRNACPSDQTEESIYAIVYKAACIFSVVFHIIYTAKQIFASSSPGGLPARDGERGGDGLAEILESVSTAVSPIAFTSINISSFRLTNLLASFARMATTLSSPPSLLSSTGTPKNHLVLRETLPLIRNDEGGNEDAARVKGRTQHMDRWRVSPSKSARLVHRLTASPTDIVSGSPFFSISLCPHTSRAR